jgi:cation diffusion facilitator family transporter
MTSNPSQHSGTEPRPSLTRFAWLSIAAAIVTIVLKTVAYELTGSVGLLSDALESLVNLVAAIVALVALTVAAREPDEERGYGYTKAEYFSSGIEGGLIFLAALTILYTAVDRLLHPAPVEALGLGIVISSLASLVNLAVALRLRRAGREHHSITLEADAKHLMTDVWTTAGVVAGVGAVALTGWLRLDPLIAMAVGINIIWSGVHLVRRSAAGLLDTAIPPAERAQLDSVLVSHQDRGIQFHAIRTRQAGARRFISLHVLVPGRWTIQEGHDLLELLDHEIRTALPLTSVFTHIEPLEDPSSWEDVGLDRPARGEGHAERAGAGAEHRQPPEGGGTL